MDIQILEDIQEKIKDYRHLQFFNNMLTEIYFIENDKNKDTLKEILRYFSNNYSYYIELKAEIIEIINDESKANILFTYIDNEINEIREKEKNANSYFGKIDEVPDKPEEIFPDIYSKKDSKKDSEEDSEEDIQEDIKEAEFYPEDFDEEEEDIKEDIQEEKKEENDIINVFKFMSNVYSDLVKANIVEGVQKTLYKKLIKIRRYLEFINNIVESDISYISEIQKIITLTNYIKINKENTNIFIYNINYYHADTHIINNLKKYHDLNISKITKILSTIINDTNKGGKKKKKGKKILKKYNLRI